MSKIVPIRPECSHLRLLEEMVSLDSLQRVLEAAFIDCERRGDRLHVLDGLDDPCAIAIDDEHKFVVVISYIECSLPEHLLLTKLNELNATLLLARFHRDDAGDVVWVEYFMTYEGGLDARQFVKLLRRFAKIVNCVERDVLSTSSECIGGTSS